MVERIGRSEQIDLISEDLGIYKTTVENVFKAYTGYIRYCIDRSYETGWLGIIIFRNNAHKGTGDDYYETYSYQVNVVAREINESPVLVKGILDYLREMIRKDILLHINYSIFKLGTIGISDDKKLKLSSSSSLPSGVRIRSTNRFRKEINTGQGDLIAG